MRSPQGNSLRIENLFAAYDRADVLEDVSVAVQAGAVTCLLGSNGSGKTTLIRAILGLTPPRAGRIFLGETDIVGWPTHRIIGMGVACIPEGRKVFPALTTEENLRLGAFQETSAEVLAKRFENVYRLFPRLKERRTQLAGTMSGGEQAMVSIGRGLMGAPRLLLVDEPSLGLAPLLVRENFATIRKINAQGVSVFLVEQNVKQTLAIADYGYVFSKGRVVAQGSSQELQENVEVQRAYFG
jgi:branched-chain amino acid transport system ATP-binding protein